MLVEQSEKTKKKNLTAPNNKTTKFQVDFRPGFKMRIIENLKKS